MAGDRESGHNAYSLFLIFILLYLSQKSIKASAYHQDSKSEQQGTSLNEKFAVLTPDGEVTEFSPSQEDSMEEKMEEQNVVEETEANELEEVVEPDITWDPIIGENEVIQPDEPEEIEDIAIPMGNTVTPIEEKEEAAEEVDQFEQVEEEAKEEAIEDIQPIDMSESQKDSEDIPMMPEAEIKGNEKEIVEDEPVLGGQSNLFLKPTVMNSVKPKKQQPGPKISFNYGN